MKKAELEAKLAQLEKENENLKGEQNMTNSTTTADKTAKTNAKQYNVFDNTYRTLVKAYIESGNKNEFTIFVRFYFDSEFDTVDKETKAPKHVKIDGAGKVLNFLYKHNGLKVAGYKRDIVEGIEGYRINIKDFDIKTRVPGKFGEYSVFAKALGRLMTA